jgi:hypothetical protein
MLRIGKKLDSSHLLTDKDLFIEIGFGTTHVIFNLVFSPFHLLSPGGECFVQITKFYC